MGEDSYIKFTGGARRTFKDLKSIKSINVNFTFYLLKSILLFKQALKNVVFS